MEPTSRGLLVMTYAARGGVWGRNVPMGVWKDATVKSRIFLGYEGGRVESGNQTWGGHHGMN